jgi:hypothetical protein
MFKVKHIGVCDVREMLSGHYVISDVGRVVYIGVDFPHCDLDVEVPGHSFIPTFDHHCLGIMMKK